MSKNLAEIRYYQHYNRLYNKYKLIALDCFEWKNLPNNIESRFIENFLYTNGECFLFKDNNLGLIVLPSKPTGKYNIYNEPTVLTITGYNYTKNMEITRGIRILNNDLGFNTHEYVADYAKRMTNVERCINANISQQKFPFMLSCDENTRFTMKNLFNNVEDGDPVIYYNKNLQLDTIRVFNFNIPYVVDKLTQYKINLENEMLSFFGLNNATQKRERMLVDEVNANNDYIDKNIDLMYKSRQIACVEINRKFGLNVEVIRKNEVVIEK